MINLTPEQQKKIELLDILFHTASVEELQQIADLERNVQKLKGDNVKPATFSNFINEYNRMISSTIILEGEVYMLKADLQQVVKALQGLYTLPYNLEFQNLKSKYNVY